VKRRHDYRQYNSGAVKCKVQKGDEWKIIEYLQDRPQTKNLEKRYNNFIDGQEGWYGIDALCQ
jgi:hypothetical protein